MTFEQHIYKGHAISVHAFIDEGRWGWQAKIDDRTPMTLRWSPAADEKEARVEALAAARSVIDLLGRPIF